MRCGNSAAKGVSARQVLGKTRHVNVRFLWLQQTAQDGRLKVLLVPTREYLSDTFTKALPQVEADPCYRCVTFFFRSVGSG